MTDLRQLANELEWSNYARTAYFATVVPGVQVCISSEVVLITDPSVPLVDGNHAAMLHATPETVDGLIDRVVRHYQERGLKPHAVVSPGCTPDDLSRRLEAHGFVAQGDPESWLVLRNPLAIAPFVEAIPTPNNVMVREIGAADIPVFCRVMAAAFGMPEDALPILYHSFGHINELPGIHNYLAYLDGQPAGCASLFSYLGYGALGSMSVLPGVRHSGVMLALGKHSYLDWKKDGNRVAIFQTALPWLERMLVNTYGCEHVFARTYYAYTG